VAIIASGRQTTEELYLIKKLATRLGAVTDSVAHEGEGDSLLVNADKNPNSNGARLTGISFTEAGFRIPKIADGIAAGTIKSLIVIGEDVAQQGIGPELLAKLDLLVVSDVLPNETTNLAHYLLPGCAPAEKRGTFINVKGRLQKFMKAVEPRGDARPEWEFLHELFQALGGENGFATIEGLFNRMAKEVPALTGLEWAKIGDTGVQVPV
jgi:NADH-quinone oxidoreductase subunit G